MDEDMKTLLAILALIYGSANGVGLFKTSLDPVKADTVIVNGWIEGAATAVAVVRDGMKKLRRKLFSLGVVAYAAMSILPPIFLGLVVRYGARDALQRIGLGGAAATSVGPGRSLFYWILFFLSLLTAWQLLADYRAAWSTVFKAWWWARKKEAAQAPRA
jgi:hypothetical protein